MSVINTACLLFSLVILCFPLFPLVFLFLIPQMTDSNSSSVPVSALASSASVSASSESELTENSYQSKRYVVRQATQIDRWNVIDYLQTDYANKVKDQKVRDVEEIITRKSLVDSSWRLLGIISRAADEGCLYVIIDKRVEDDYKSMYDKNYVMGYLAFDVHPTTISIRLIEIAPSIRGKKFGKRLLLEAEKCMVSRYNNLRMAFTDRENSQYEFSVVAQDYRSFWLKCGYQVNKNNQNEMVKLVKADTV